jgi:phosphatidylglycerophosphatase A
LNIEDFFKRFILQPLEPEHKSNFLKIPYAYRLIATGLGSGYSPFAPGTAGSVVGIALYIPFTFLPQAVLLVATILVFIIGTIASAKVEKALGEDPSVVVVDEVVGMWVSLLFIPFSFRAVLFAFFFFRIFDIFKPPPARESEALKNGLGIMTDDVIAGVYANLVTRILLLFIVKNTIF